MIAERQMGDRIADLLIWLVLTILAISCLLPFLVVVAKSLSSSNAVITNQVTLWPIGFNLDNYGFLARDQLFLRSFATSIMRVIVGVPLTLLLCAVTAYPLSQDKIYMPGRTLFKVVMLIGLLFSVGLIPTYMAYKSLGLLNKFAVLVLPGALNVFYTIIVINFFRGIPQELSESAMLDGANHWHILFRIFLPLSLPVLATVALFSAVQHWNSWFDGIVFLAKREQWPLQSYLYVQVTTRSLVRVAESSLNGSTSLLYSQATPEALQAAMIVLAALPIMLVYPFLQRYFVKGLTLGAVKQ